MIYLSWLVFAFAAGVLLGGFMERWAKKPRQQLSINVVAGVVLPMPDDPDWAPIEGSGDFRCCNGPISIGHTGAVYVGGRYLGTAEAYSRVVTRTVAQRVVDRHMLGLREISADSSTA